MRNFFCIASMWSVVLGGIGVAWLIDSIGHKLIRLLMPAHIHFLIAPVLVGFVLSLQAAFYTREVMRRKT